MSETKTNMNIHSNKRTIDGNAMLDARCGAGDVIRAVSTSLWDEMCNHIGKDHLLAGRTIVITIESFPPYPLATPQEAHDA